MHADFEPTFSTEYMHAVERLSDTLVEKTGGKAKILIAQPCKYV